MSDRNDELTKLVEELIRTTNQTLQQHAGELARLNDNLVASHATTSNHADAIEELRKHQHGLAELVNTQSRVVSALQSLMLQVLKHLGLEGNSGSAAKVN